VLSHLRGRMFRLLGAGMGARLSTSRASGPEAGVSLAVGCLAGLSLGCGFFVFFLGCPFRGDGLFFFAAPFCFVCVPFFSWFMFFYLFTSCSFCCVFCTGSSVSSREEGVRIAMGGDLFRVTILCSAMFLFSFGRVVGEDVLLSWADLRTV